MDYKNLSELIENEDRGKAYFNSLPHLIQTEVLAAGESIHNTVQLHEKARDAGERFRREILSKKDYS